MYGNVFDDDDRSTTGNKEQKYPTTNYVIRN